MDFKDLHSATNRVTTIAFYGGFGLIAILQTILVLVEDAPIWDKVKFLGLSYLILGMGYGIFRFLRYIFSE